ncbi:MAG: alpha/beta hydrolase [Halioglobus sp.]|nr:alpha/beta hydrolase [Halioglobus sp.]
MSAAPKMENKRMEWLLFLLAFVALVLVARRYFATRVWPSVADEVFEGTVLRLGQNLLCLPDRSHLDADEVGRTTLVCFPGFLEDMRYFLEVHRDTPARLIVLNNGNYHNPFRGVSPSTPEWFKGNPHPVGTIAHDAFCVNQVLEHMTGPERVVVHGHSRGGAVMLEAGHQSPELARHVEVILEAAVVPRGRLYQNGEKRLQPVGFFLLPFMLSLMRVAPRSRLLDSPMMWVTNATKNRLVASIPFTPRQYATAETNSRNIIEWQATSGIALFDNFKRMTLFVGERDGVLCRDAMLQSASQSDAVEVIETCGTDHFISLEKPELIQAYFNRQ